MSLETHEGERPVHFPADPAKFGFDAEVSAIFPDMARRSIPNFYESHATHAAMLEPYINGRDISVLDIGASRGAFFAALVKHYGEAKVTTRMLLDAIDNSPDMCKYLQDAYPLANVRCLDITSDDFLGERTQYDVVCAHYVLQFVPRLDQSRVLRKIFAKVKPGGILIFGHKSAYYGALGDTAHEQYIQFRIANGYTREEIAAKTKALGNAMFCMDHDVLMGTLQAHFSHVQETFRFMMFSTLMAVK